MRKAVACLACGLFASTAHAEMIPNSQISYGNWSGDAYTFDGTTDFSHCVVTAGYRNGHDLYFSVTSSGIANVGLSNPHWTFNVGDTFNVELVVDNRTSFSGTATAVDQNAVLLSLSDLERALSAFRRGYTMTAYSPGFEATFDLSGTFKALDLVLNCAVYY